MHGRERKGEEKEEFFFSRLEILKKKTDFALGSELGSEEENKEKIENRRNSSTVTLIQMLYWFLMMTDNS